jgi:hypothetical protein
MTERLSSLRDNGPIDDIITELDKVVDFMRRRCVTRLRLFNNEIELAQYPVAEPTATVEASQESAPMLTSPEPSLCKCGHDLDTEHNQLGCLFGCSEVLCRSEEEQHDTDMA